MAQGRDVYLVWRIPLVFLCCYVNSWVLKGLLWCMGDIETILTRSKTRRQQFYERMSNVVASVSMLQKKKCIACPTEFWVEPAELKWKTLCDKCYETYPHRKCRNCGNNLAIDSPKWAKVCTSCWVEKRKQTHEECPTCPPVRAKQLRKKKTDKCCKDCAKELMQQLSADDFSHKLKRAREEESKKEEKPATELSCDERTLLLSLLKKEKESQAAANVQSA